MLVAEYRRWLIENKVSSISTFLTKAQKVEEYEGNLDEHYKKDKCASLLAKLTYSTVDQFERKTPLHSIPIDPIKNDIYKAYYDSTRDYKSRVNKYVKFLNECSQKNNL